MYVATYYALIYLCTTMYIRYNYVCSMKASTPLNNLCMWDLF